MEASVKAVELKDLWRRYRADGDERARERLVVAYSPLVKYVAGRMASGLPAHVEEADLISYGLVGLISAIERFDPEREIKFETYAIPRVRGAIIDELRALDWVPRSVRARAREIERANVKLEHQLQRAPTDEEMAAELHITMDEFHEALIQISNSTIAALDELWTVSDTSGDQVSLLDTLQDPEAPDPAQGHRRVRAEGPHRRRHRPVARAREARDRPLLLREPDPARDRRGAGSDRITHLAAAHQGRAAAALAAGGGGGCGLVPTDRLGGSAYEERKPMHKPADRIRNVALVGHRGSGKTSLHEALLHQAGAVNRLGSVVDGTTVSDADSDEKARQMSISAALASFEWSDRKVNLIDTPGEPSFVADALGALRVCESAIFVINAVMGVEVSTTRLWQRADELDLARLIFVNMLDRERADFFRTLDSLKSAFGQHVVATEIPIGSEHEVRGVIDLVDMKGYEYDGNGRDNCREIPIPDELAEQAQEYREKLMDEVSETSDALMERYLEGEEISHEEIVAALKEGTNHGDIFPVTCGVATRNLATNRLLDAVVEDLPSPVKHGALELDELSLEADEDADLYAFVFKTRADPFAGRINLFRVYQGVMRHDTQVVNARTENKERIGQLLVFSGKDSEHVDDFGPGDIGAVAKLKETRAGDWLVTKAAEVAMPQISLPNPVMAFAIEPKTKGSEDKVFTALRRLQEEDPTIDVHRDPQTGEQIVAGLSQIHVEVIVERMRDRFGAEVNLAPPRVPYQETIRSGAKAHGRHKKQSGGRGQFGDCHIEIEPLAGDDFEFVNAIKGGVIPTSFIPAVEKGIVEAMQAGTVAGYPVKGVRVRLFDGQYHSVDSSEMAFKIAGSLAMKQALDQAGAVLLEPIMLVTLSVPEDSVGDVIGDLNSRRGRPLGMEPVGGMTEIKAEVPMAEMLTYAPDLRSLTAGQGEYTMDFARYEEVPGHLAQKVVEEARSEEGATA